MPSDLAEYPENYDEWGYAGEDLDDEFEVSKPSIYQSKRFNNGFMRGYSEARQGRESCFDELVRYYQDSQSYFVQGYIYGYTKGCRKRS